MKPRLRSRWTIAALVAVLAAAIGITLAVGSSADIKTRQQFVTGTPEGGQPVKLDTTLYLPDSTPAPAILLAHGFGGTKNSVDGEARSLAEHGYVVLTWTARGFGESGGKIHLDQPDFEVADARKLVDYLTTLPQVDKNRIGVAGASYGGGLALLLAGYDKRIKAVAADITWNNLEQSLFPNGRVQEDLDGRAVRQRLRRRRHRRAAAGSPPDACAAYQASARTGEPTPALRTLLSRSQPRDDPEPHHGADLAQSGRAGLAVPAQPGRRERARHRRAPARRSRSSGARAGTTRSVRAPTPRRTLRSPGSATVFHGGVSGTQQFQIDQQSGSQSEETGNGDQRRLVANGYPGIDGTRSAHQHGGARRPAAGDRRARGRSARRDHVDPRPVRTVRPLRQPLRRPVGRPRPGRRLRLAGAVDRACPPRAGRPRSSPSPQATTAMSRSSSRCATSAAQRSTSSALAGGASRASGDIAGELTGDAAGATRHAGAVARHEGRRAAHGHGRVCRRSSTPSRPGTAPC